MCGSSTAAGGCAVVQQAAASAAVQQATHDPMQSTPFLGARAVMDCILCVCRGSYGVCVVVAGGVCVMGSRRICPAGKAFLCDNSSGASQRSSWLLGWLLVLTLWHGYRHVCPAICKPAVLQDMCWHPSASSCTTGFLLWSGPLLVCCYCCLAVVCCWFLCLRLVSRVGRHVGNLKTPCGARACGGATAYAVLCGTTSGFWVHLHVCGLLVSCLLHTAS